MDIFAKLHFYRCVFGKFSDTAYSANLCGASPAGWGHPALRGNKRHCAVGAGHCPARGFAAITILRVIRRGGIYAARCSHTGNATYRVNHPKGFPLRGKLSPQVTDEGVPAGRFPLIRRARAPPSPKGGRLSRRGGALPRPRFYGNNHFTGNP